MSGQAKRRRRWSPTLAEKTARVGYPLFRDQSLYNFSRARDCFCPGGWTGKGYQSIYFRSRQKLAVYRGRRAPRGFQRIGYYKQAEAHVSRCSRRGPIESMISLGNKLPDPLICLRQRLLIRQEYDAEVPGSGLLAEAGAMNHKYMFLQAKFFDENIVGFADIESRESVERATRRNTAEMRGGDRPLHGEITAGGQLAANLD